MMKLNNMLFVGIIAIFILLPVVSAYTDPGTGMLIWQLLAAGFVGLAFYFIRFSKWVKNYFKKRKENEE